MLKAESVITPTVEQEKQEEQQQVNLKPFKQAPVITVEKEEDQVTIDEKENPQEQAQEQQQDEEEAKEYAELQEQRLQQMEEMQSLMKEYQEKMDQLQKLKEMKMQQELYAKKQLQTLGDRESELNELLSMMDTIRQLKAEAGMTTESNDETLIQEEVDVDVDDEDEVDEEEDDDDDFMPSGNQDDEDDEIEVVDLKNDSLEILDKRLDKMAISQEKLKGSILHDKEFEVKEKLQQKLLQLAQVQAEVNYYASALANAPLSVSTAAPETSNNVMDDKKSTLMQSFEKLLDQKGPKSYEFLAAMLDLFTNVNSSESWNQVYSVVKKVIISNSEMSERSFIDTLVSYLASIFYLLQEKGVKDLNAPTSTLIKEAFIDIWTQTVSEQDTEFTMDKEYETELDAIFELYGGKPLPEIKEDLIVNLIEFVTTHSSEVVA